MAISPNTEVLVTSDTSRDETSYVDWPAIFAGVVLSLAISFVLLTFGSALGLSAASPYEGESALSGFAVLVGATLWLLWVQISACVAGGYLAGRLRRRKFDSTEHESDIRDGSHGIVVWALGVLVGATLLVSGVSGVVSTATTAVGSAAGGAAQGAALAANAATGEPDFSLSVDRFLRGNGSADQAVTADTREEVSRILGTLSDGEVSAEDRTYLAQTLAARTGVDQPTAEARVNDLITASQEAVQSARDAAETARKTALIAAFVAAASLLISGVGAFFGATLGGRHRDQGTILAGWGR